ncbi:MAG: hypothetical protein AAF447_21895 [Myxococcota bacterium]
MESASPRERALAGRGERRRRWALLLTLALAGCDGLGNPPLDRTLAAAWSCPAYPGLSLETASRSLRGPRAAEELLAAELDHREPIDDEAWGTVVSVRLRVERSARPPARLRLQTDLLYADGQRRVVTWPPLRPAASFLAALASPAPPVRVVTRLVDS